MLNSTIKYFILPILSTSFMLGCDDKLNKDDSNINDKSVKVDTPEAPKEPLNKNTETTSKTEPPPPEQSINESLSIIQDSNLIKTEESQEALNKIQETLLAIGNEQLIDQQSIDQLKNAVEIVENQINSEIREIVPELIDNTPQIITQEDKKHKPHKVHHKKSENNDKEISSKQITLELKSVADQLRVIIERFNQANQIIVDITSNQIDQENQPDKTHNLSKHKK